MIIARFGDFYCDWFASSWSVRTKMFASRFNDRGTAVVDAFTGDCFHPPIELVAEVLDKAREEDARGILVIPDWVSSHVSLVMDMAEDSVQFRECMSLEMISAEFVVNKVFHGVPDFSMKIYELGAPAHA